jgi:hypothetical protein
VAIDLTSGMDPSVDFVTALAPSDPTRREGASMWIWDDAGRFGLPRVAVEAVGATWTEHRTIMFNVAFPDGRVLVSWGNEAPHRPEGDDGIPRLLGGGPLRLECVEPFARWRVTFDGNAVETTVEHQLAGRSAYAPAAAHERAIELFIEVEARMAVPPWIQGSLQPEGHFVVGEERFEQLFAAEGLVRVDGTEAHFSGSGLRIHRKGGNRSDYSDWFGHCWQSARFPSGRAFGSIHYAPRPDGSVKYREGYVFDGNDLIPARVINTPWMTKMAPAGQDVSFSLESKLGRADIEGETYASTFVPELKLGDDVSFPPLQQGIARYRWDGEEAYGMIERSYPVTMMEA